MSAIVDSLTSSLRADPDSWRCRLALIEVLLTEDRRDEASQLLEEIDELPSDVDSQILAARAYGLFEPSSGIEILDQILENYPENAEAHLEKARLCKNAGEYEQSRHHYAQALKLDPSKQDRSLEAIFGGVPPEESSAPGDSFSDAIQQAREAAFAILSQTEHRAKIQSLIIGVAMTLILCIMMIFVVTSGPEPEPPKIVASIPPESEAPVDDPLQKLKEKNPTPSTPPQGAMSINVASVTAPSTISVAPMDSTSFGMSDATLSMGFGPSMSLGNAGGSSAMFFGSRSTGKRFLFVLDASRSMKENQVELRNQELNRALRGLRGVEYQVLLFAGGAYFAEEGWGVHPKDRAGRYGPEKYESPDGDYEFVAKSLFSFHLVGDEDKFPAPKWKKADPITIRKSIEFVEKSKLFSGTDWDNALRIAHLMDPPPDVIFFMSDGLDSELDTSSIIRNSNRNGRSKINSIAMQTKEGAENFAEIADRTGGTYTIVDKNGEPIDGFDYMDNPEKYKGRLR